jgi:hypothetical protein
MLPRPCGGIIDSRHNLSQDQIDKSVVRWGLPATPGSPSRLAETRGSTHRYGWSCTEWMKCGFDLGGMGLGGL